MQAYGNDLSSTLIERYKLYLQAFLVDLWRERGLIEFRFSYAPGPRIIQVYSKG